MSSHNVIAAEMVASLIVCCPKCGSDARIVSTVKVGLDGQIILPKSVEGEPSCRACDEAAREEASAVERERRKFRKGPRLVGGAP